MRETNASRMTSHSSRDLTSPNSGSRARCVNMSGFDLIYIPTFVLAFFRITGMMLFAPLFGSARIPRRVRVTLALVLAMAIAPGVRLVALPETPWGLAAGIAGEMAFGFAMGMMQSFTFIAAQWAGEIVG